MTFLQCEDLELELMPESGGTLKFLRFMGQDILRPAGENSGHPTETAAFPMFPFCGRIADGKMSVDGREISLPYNFPPEKHAVHGQAWLAPWLVTQSSKHAAILTFDHIGKDWPWQYRAEQIFKLDGHCLHIELKLQNRSEQIMPAGIGWHPYFPRKGAFVKAGVSTVWPTGSSTIPDKPEDLSAWCDLREPRQASGLTLDTPFSMAEHKSVVAWPERNLRATMTTGEIMGQLVVYTPPGEDFFCVEPLSHIPNAVNSTLPASLTGHKVLEPGETMAGHISLTIAPMTE